MNKQKIEFFMRGDKKIVNNLTLFCCFKIIAIVLIDTKKKKFVNGKQINPSLDPGSENTFPAFFIIPFHKCFV